MWCADPVWLVLLLLSVPVITWWWRGGALRRWTAAGLGSLVLRLVVVIALALTAAGVRWTVADSTTQRAVILADDQPAPFDRADSVIVQTPTGLRIESSPRWPWPAPLREDAESPDDRSNVQEAVSVASAMLPPGSAEVWVPQHRWDDLDLSRDRLAVSGVALHGYDTTVEPSNWLEVQAPGNALPGAKLMATTRFNPAAGEADQLRLVFDHGTTGRTVDLETDQRDARVQLISPEQAGLHQLTATLVDGDGEPRTTAETAIWVDRPLQIAVIDTAGRSDEVAATTDRLRRLWGAGAEVTPLSSNDVNAETLDGFQLVVALSGTHPETSVVLSDAVRRGVGLLALASPTGLPQVTDPLAQALPARGRQTMEQRDPSVALVIIIDTSGSMGGARMPLAKQVAEFTIRRLMPHDRVGIVEFYGSRRWAAPMQPASNQIEIRRGLHRLTAGGGTIILPAIDEAYYAQLNTRARFKHVLILTDGGVETGPFREKIERMRKAGITTSTVLLGPAQHSQFLTSLAQWGGGQSYQAPDRFQLPEIAFKQVDEQRHNPFAETPGRAQMWDVGPADVDTVTELELGGYHRIDAKPTSHCVATAADSGEPLAVWWQYGRGRAGVWAASLTGSAAAEVFKDADAARWMRQWMLSLAAVGDDRRITIRPVPIEQGLLCNLQWVGTGSAPRDEVIMLQCLDASGGVVSEAEADPIGFGRWNARLLAADRGSVTLRAVTHGGLVLGQTATWLDGRTPHRLDDTPSASQAEIAGASAQASPAWHVIDPSGWLLALAWVGVLGELVLRRFSGSMRRLRPRVVVEGGKAATLLLVLSLSAVTNVNAAAPTDRSGMEASEQAAENAERLLVDAIRGGTDVDAQVQMLAEQGRWPLAIALADEAGLTQRCIELGQAARGAGQAGAVELATLARHLEAQGRLTEARQVLQEAIEIAPTSQMTGLRLRLDVLSAIPHDPTSAIGSVTADHPTDDLTKRWLGHYAALLGQPAEATQLFAALGSPTVHDLLTLAGQRRQMGETTDALAALSEAELIVSRTADRRTIALMQFRLAIESGEEKALARQWMNDRPIPASRFWPLMTLLRRTDQPLEAVRLAAEAASPREQTSPEFDASMLRRELLSVAMDTSAGDAAVAALRTLAEQEDQSVWGACLGQVLMLQGDREGAERALMDAAAGAGDASRQLWCADAADEVGAYELALRIAEQAGRQGGKAALEAGLWRGTHLAERGRITDALAILNETAALAGDAAKARRLAEAYTEIGRPDVALDQLQRWLEDHGGPLEHESLTAYLAWQFEQQEHDGAALDLWRQLWQKGGTPAMRQRAQQQMLELSSRSGDLGTIAVEMEQRISDNASDEVAVGMLVDLYLRIDDPISASVLLLATHNSTGDQLSAKQRLAQLYLRTGRLRLADAVLDELITLDPEGAIDYWQQRAVLAAERGDLSAAEVAIEAMRLSQDMPQSHFDELSAGVHAMLGDSRVAADEYRLTLLNDSQHVELWLLWAQAMRDARLTDQAIARLLCLVERAEDDDLFLVGVDGLLNLDASQAVLEAALRRAVLRAAAYPDRAYLIRVAVDLAEALGDGDTALSWMDPILLADGDRAVMLLRESVERAAALGQHETAGVYGQLLVATGQAVPPEVMIGLGDMLLSQGETEGADRAFQRAVQFGERGTVVPQVADRYERAFRPKVASRLLNELLLSRPDDVDLLYRQASVFGQLDQWDQARQCYVRAIEIMLSRMSLRAADEPLADLLAVRRRRVASDISEVQSYFGPCVDGLIFTAFDDTARSEVVQRLTELAERAARESHPLVEPGDNASRFPRWVHAADALRYAALTTHQLDASGVVDEQLAATFQSDRTLHQRIAVMRRAFLPAAVAPGESPDEEGPQSSIALAELSLRRGDLDEAASRLANALKSDPQWTAELLARAAALGVGIDRLDLTAEAVRLGLEQAFELGEAEQVVRVTQQLLPLGWHALSKTEQRWVVDRLDATCEEEEDPALLLLQLRVHAWTDSTEALSDIQVDRAIGLADREGVGPETVVAVMHLLNPDDAAAALRLAWKRRGQAERWLLLREVAAGLSRPPEPPVQAVLDELVSKTPNPKLDEFRPYTVLRRGSWSENPAGATLAVAMLESLLAEHPDQPAVLTLLARALHSAGGEQRLDRASRLARSALESLAGQTVLTTDQVYIAVDAQTTLKPAHVTEWLTELAERRRQGLARVNELLMASMAAAGVGMDTPAVELAREAFTRTPGEPVVRNWTIDLLFDHQRYVALAELLWPYRADRSVVQERSVRPFSEALRQLGAPRQALEIASTDERALGAIAALPLRAALGQDGGVRLRLLQFFNETRLERRFYSPRLWRPPPPDGVVGYRITVDMELSDRRMLWEELAGLPCAEQLFEARLRTASAGRTDVPGLIGGLADALLIAGRAETRSLALAERVHDSEHLDLIDLRLLLALARRLEEPNDSAITGLADWLGQSLAGPSDDEVAQLIDILPLDRPGWGPALQRWLVARRAVGVTKSRFPAPAVEQPASLAHLLQPTPFAPPTSLLTQVLGDSVLAWPNDQRVQLLAQLEHGGNSAVSGRQLIDLIRLRVHLSVSLGDWAKANEGLGALLSREQARALPADPKLLLKALDRHDAERLGSLLLEQLKDPGQPVAGGETNRLALTCLLASAAHDQGLDTLAQASLDIAESLMPQAPASGWLFVIDAAESVNPARATELAIGMAEVGALPPRRLEALMGSVPSLNPDQFQQYLRWRED
jgi:tetratricopeptide (TPR) repeat protein